MAKQYQAGPKFTTPRAAAIWPHLVTPDTKHDAAGAYDCKVQLPVNDPVVKKIRAKALELAEAKYEEVRAQYADDPKVYFDEEAYEAKVKELKGSGKKALAEKLKLISLVQPLAPDIDDEGDETGTVTLKAKMKASGTYKSGPKQGKTWNRRPDIYDAKGNKLKNPPEIGGGSDVKLSVELSAYFAANDGNVGCSFRLEAAQVIKLVQFGNRDAASYGFGAEEDGDDLTGLEGSGSDLDDDEGLYGGTSGADEDDEF